MITKTETLNKYIENEAKELATIYSQLYEELGRKDWLFRVVVHHRFKSVNGATVDRLLDVLKFPSEEKSS